jgi:hypothetical protein
MSQPQSKATNSTCDPRAQSHGYSAEITASNNLTCTWRPTENECAIFAHCYACGSATDSDLAATLVAGLRSDGLEVVEIDFSGLSGTSTASAGTIDQILDTSACLSSQGKRPVLLIGHSIAAPAVFYAASHIRDAQAFVSISAPLSLFTLGNSITQAAHRLLRPGAATTEVDLGGIHDFSLRPQLVHSLGSLQRTGGWPTELRRKPLLAFHGALDDTVSPNHALALVSVAGSSGSPLALPRSRHLSLDPSDAQWAAERLAQWWRHQRVNSAHTSTAISTLRR